jgi:hypothetical protein
VQLDVLTVKCMRIVMLIMSWTSKFIWTMTEFATEMRMADAGGISYSGLTSTGCLSLLDALTLALGIGNENLI